MDFANIADEVAQASPVEQVSIPVVPGRVVDIDGDILCYEHGTKDTQAEAWGTLCERVRFIQAMAGAEKHLVHLTCPGSHKGHRMLVAQTRPYQSHRKGSRKPKHWEFLRLRLAELNRNGGELEVYMWTDREADDGLALAAYHNPANRVIATNDKDLRMCTGWHFNWNTLELHWVPPGTYEQAIGGKVYGYKWFLLQLLQGDTADNIPGVGPHGDYKRGVGDKTAAKILAPATQVEEAWALVVQAYKTAHGDYWADVLAEQASLLWMRTDSRAHHTNWFVKAGRYFETEDYNELAAAQYRQMDRVRKLNEEAQAIVNQD